MGYTYRDFEEYYNDIVLERGFLRGRLWIWSQIMIIVPKKIYNSTWWSVIMLKNYIKIALRNTIKHKTYSSINILGLVAGLTCSLLLLLFVNNELTFDGMHSKRDSIYRVVSLERVSNGGDRHHGISLLPLGLAMKTEIPEVVNSVRMSGSGRLSIIVNNTTLYEGEHLFADPSFFEIFDYTLERGNVNTAMSDPHSVILTQQGAEKYFGTENPMGKTINVQRLGDMTVTGVLNKIPDNTHIKFNMIFPITVGSSVGFDDTNWEQFGAYTYVELVENADAGSLEPKLRDIINKNRGIDAWDQIAVYLQPMSDIHFNSSHIINDFNYKKGDKIYITIVSVIAMIIIVIASFNFINLSTARSLTRSKEIGIRKVVGAYRQQLLKQVLSESMITAVISMAISLMVVKMLIPSFNTLSGSVLEFGFILQSNVILMMAGIILFIGFLAGLYPALIISGFSPVRSLKGINNSGGKGASIRKGLVFLQFTMSIIMIIATFTTKNQLDFVRNKLLGLNKEGIVTIEINTGMVRANYNTIREQMSQYAGVTNVSISSKVPFGRQAINDTRVIPEGFDEADEIYMREISVDDHFVDLYELEIASGKNVSRELGKYENTTLINESAANLIGWDDPVGRKIQIPGADIEATVVGVVKDFHYESLHEKIAPLIMYVNDPRMDYISIKYSASDIPSLLAYMEGIMGEHDPNPTEFAFVDETFDNLYRNDEKMSSIFGYSSILAIIIACSGLFGLAVFNMERRTKELGIRKVLGASVSGIFIQLLKDQFKIIVLANLIAIPVSIYVMNSWLNSAFAYQTSLSPFTFVFAALFSLLITVLFVGYPSLKAAMTNPVETLKYE